jgi:hypothetical protein
MNGNDMLRDLGFRIKERLRYLGEMRVAFEGVSNDQKLGINA